MADITGLDLEPLDPAAQDWSKHDDGAFVLPPKGLYDVTTPPATGFTFRAGKSKQLVAKIDTLTIAVGPHRGKKIRFTSVSNKPFITEKGWTSQAARYLEAFGVTAQPRSHAEYATLIEATANRTARVRTDWRASCKCVDPATQQRWELKGQDKFGRDEQGNAISTVTCPFCQDGVLANLEVTGWVPVKRAAV